jgi:hypothetical protein
MNTPPIDCARFIAGFAARAAVASALICSAAAMAQTPLLAPFNGSGATPPPPWRISTLPHQTKPVTQFTLESVDGHSTLRVEAVESYGTLVHALEGESMQARKLKWRWRVDQPLAQANLRERSGDDTAVKVCALFDEPLDSMSFGDRNWLRLARANDPLTPAASVCYVWDHDLSPGTTLHNAFTHRVRYLVLRSGESAPGEWAKESRDLGADFLRLFGDESPTVPPLVGILVGADSDNTHGHSLAHVADLELLP